MTLCHSTGLLLRMSTEFSESQSFTGVFFSKYMRAVCKQIFVGVIVYYIYDHQC